MQAPHRERFAEDPIEDGSEGYSEEKSAEVIENHMGEEVFEDAPEEIELKEDVVEGNVGAEVYDNAPEAVIVEAKIVQGCSRFGCRVPDGFSEVVLCVNPICKRMMHVECYKTM